MCKPISYIKQQLQNNILLNQNQNLTYIKKYLQYNLYLTHISKLFTIQSTSNTFIHIYLFLISNNKKVSCHSLQISSMFGCPVARCLKIFEM